MQMITVKKTSIAALFILFFFLLAGFSEFAEARSRGGGRSFGGGGYSRSISRPAPRTAPRQASQAAPLATRPNSGFGGSFTRGLAGGVMGGFLGNMLFGGMAHGTGMGGVGGSGMGLFEILILVGLGYFLYKKFLKRPTTGAAFGQGSAYARSMQGQTPDLFNGYRQPETASTELDEDDPLVAGVKQIWQVDETFHPDRFKETAQDLFFKIQAGWTHRETDALRNLVGNQLLSEYASHFSEMKEKGQINRLENIAVRKVDLVQAGVEAGEIFVTVRFTANLLDYTVDERSGEIVDGDRENPVKFDENWTFARRVGTSVWKLEGIEVQ